MGKQILAIQILLVLFLWDSICPAVNKEADIDGNFFVDFNDFAILANDWRENGSNLEGDITGDLQVDFKDILELADAWLDCFVEPSNSLVPTDGAISVDPNGILRWSAGEGASSHNVYLGTGFNDVNNADALSPEFKDNQTATTYAPSNLDVNTTYYWRIDETGPRCTAKGNVWNFKTWLCRDPNLVGWWRFDEGTGTSVYDSARNNNGTVYDAVWTTGQINGALNFDGIDDYVEIPDNDDSLDMTSQMTITAWVKPNNVDGMYCIAVKLPDETASENFSGNYGFFIEGNCLDLWHQYAEVAETFYPSTSPPSVAAGIWQHVAVTLKTGDSVKFYINGAPAGTRPQNLPFGIVNNEPVRIGKTRSDEYGYWFYGGIDDVRIYNRELSGTEIQQIYLQGNP